VTSLVKVNIQGLGVASNVRKSLSFFPLFKYSANSLYLIFTFSKTNVNFQYIDLWSSPYTWGGSSPPSAGDLVVIGASQTIYFDASTPILSGVIILGGSLIFDDMQDVSLHAKYIIIAAGGRLQIGIKQTPFTHNTVITMYGSVASIELPIFGSKVTAIRNGTIEMHGKHVGVTWTRLSVTANVGDTTITVKDSVSKWPVGGLIVIATTGNHLSQGQTETRRITNVNQNVITLDRPLSFQHLSVTRVISGTTSVTIEAEVGLLSRNVLYQGFLLFILKDYFCHLGFSCFLFMIDFPQY